MRNINWKEGLVAVLFVFAFGLIIYGAAAVNETESQKRREMCAYAFEKSLTASDSLEVLRRFKQCELEDK